MSNTTFGKLYERQVTSPESLFMHSPFSIVTMVVRIKGQITEKMLRQAVEKIQQRHTLLRVRIMTDADNTRWFTSEGVEEVPIDVKPRHSGTDWVKIHTDACKVPFEFNKRPAIRFILVQSADVSDLVILCHHIICDGLSLAYLAHDLLQHLGDPNRKVDVLSDPAPITLDNLPGDVKQSGLVKFFVKRMNQKWAAQTITFDHQDYQALNDAYWTNFSHNILSVEFTEEETSALVTKCKHEKVTVTTALTTAFSGAQTFVENVEPYHSKTVIATSLRDPLPQSPGKAMGYYAGGVELTLKYNHKQGFWVNARAYQKKIQPKYTNQNVFSELLTWLYLDPSIFEALNFKKLGMLVSQEAPKYEELYNFGQRDDVVLQILKRDKMDSLDAKRLGAAITNLGRLNFTSTYGDLELDRLIMQPGGAFPLSQVNMVIGVVTCAGKLSLVVEYAEQALHTATATKIKDKALAFLLG